MAGLCSLTRNTYGKGEVEYLGFMPGDVLLEKVLGEAVERATGEALPPQHWPVIVRGGTLRNGREVHYLLNYSAQPRQAAYPFGAGRELLSGKPVAAAATVDLEPWGVAVVQEGAR